MPTLPGVIGATFIVSRKISKDGAAFVNTTNPVVEVGEGWYKIDLTAAETNADIVALSLIDDSTGDEVEEPALLYTASASGNLTAQEVWEYANRELTGNDAVKLTDIVSEEADLPKGPLTVLQVLQVIAKRFKRNKLSPKI